MTVLDNCRNCCVQGHQMMWCSRVYCTCSIRDDHLPSLLVVAAAAGKRRDNPRHFLRQQQPGNQQYVSLFFQPRDIVWCLQLRPQRTEPADLILSDSLQSKSAAQRTVGNFNVPWCIVGDSTWDKFGNANWGAPWDGLLIHTLVYGIGIINQTLLNLV